MPINSASNESMKYDYMRDISIIAGPLFARHPETIKRVHKTRLQLDVMCMRQWDGTDEIFSTFNC